MPVLPIRLFPDPVLRERSHSVSRIFPHAGLHSFLTDLMETLYAQSGGIGIAAPQVGVAQRVIILDVSSRDASKHRELMINPVILKMEGEVLSREGCMSLPDYTAMIRRAEKVLVSWQDDRGASHKKWSQGIEAICLQHEVDHLAGILFIDRVASLKTDIMPRKNRR